MTPSKSTRFTIRIATELHTWFKAYAQRMNTSMSEVMTEHLESLRRKGADVHTPDAHPSEPLTTELNRLQERVEEKTDQIQHLRSELTEKNRQIETLLQQHDQMQHLHALAQKNLSALTEQLDTSRQLIEDMRQRKSLWERLFRRSMPK